MLCLRKTGHRVKDCYSRSSKENPNQFKGKKKVLQANTAESRGPIAGEDDMHLVTVVSEINLLGVNLNEC